MSLVKKAEDQQLVYAEVYAPNRPDAQGEYMTRDQIQLMAHNFLRSGRLDQIDVLHNNKVVKGCNVVESFIARDDDPDFIPGSWVAAVHVSDPELWQKIKKGEINGFSMEAYVTRHEQQKQVEIPPVVSGLTSKSEDHTHRFFVTYDAQGNFRGGVTDSINGHSHKIVAGTHTEETCGHSHRFSAVDNICILEES